MLTRNDLHPYQRKSVNYIKAKKKCCLFLDMGLGKTSITLTACSDLLRDMAVCRILVVAPLRVANTVWKQEAEKWEHLNGLNIRICTGSSRERENALNSDADIYVINRENIPWMVERFHRKWKWDAVVIDESSSFKSSASKRFKAMRKVIPKIEYQVNLTGTPAPNGFMDLWSQMFLVDQGDRLEKNITRFRGKYFVQNKYSYKYEPKMYADKHIKKAIRDVCLTLKAEDYLTMPKLITVTESVALPAKILKEYKQLEKKFTMLLASGDNVTPANAGVLTNKLLQICNGAVFDEDGKAHKLHNEKLERLKEIVDDNPNENLLVAYNYTFDKDRLQKAFPNTVVLSKSGKELEAWNRREIKMLLCHPASAGHGLNAQAGGATIVWFGMNWSLELYQQFNARLYRQGQTRPVKIIHLVAAHCMDEQVALALSAKAETQDDLLNYLKRVNK